MFRTSVVALAVLWALVACGGEGELLVSGEVSPTPPAGAIEVGAFFVVSDEGFAFDEFQLVCDATSSNDGTLLTGTPFESRKFPDWTLVFRCIDDGHVTGAVVRSSPAFRRREFVGPPVVEFVGAGDGEFSELEVGGLTALSAVWENSELPSHDTAIICDRAVTGRRRARQNGGASIRQLCGERRLLYEADTRLRPARALPALVPAR